MPASHQPPYPIPSASQSLHTAPAPSISPQTLSHPLPPRPPPSSRPLQVPPSPPFKDQHEVQSRAGDTRPNDFDEFFAGLDSLRVPIPSDAAVERSSRYLQDERHGSHGFPDGDEDRGQEKDDESLPVPSPAVECGLVGSTGTKALPGDGSSTLVLDPTPHAGFLEPGSGQDTSHRQEWPRSSSDDPLPFNPPITVDSDDSATDRSAVDSTFTSPAKRDTSSRATSISHSPKADGGSNEAGTGIAGVRSTLLKRQRRRGPGTGAMHPMVAVEVPVIADRLEEGISSSMRYENGLSSRPRTRQQETRARSRREVPDTQDCKLPGKSVQCVEDDTTMSDTGGSSAHSDDTDDDYRASSEEDGSMKPPSKRRRLSTPPSGPASRRPRFRIPRAAAAAGREGDEREDCRVRTTTAKDRSTNPGNRNHGPDTYAHSRPPIDYETRSCPLPLLARGEAVMLSSRVAQVVFEMFMGRPMTASDLAGETTAAADTERDYSEREVEGLGGKRRRWTREEDDRLMTLKQDGFSWPEIEERFPHRQLGSLRQRWYTKLQNTHASNPPTNKRRQEWNCRASAGEPLPTSKPPTPVETSLGYLGGQPQPADDRATPNAKPRTPSPSSTVTAMCPVCNSVVEVEASSAFNAANNRMQVREQLRFCENHRKETARREWSRLRYPIIAWDRLDDRLTQFHPRLRRILDGSGYRSRYKSVVHEKVRKHGRKILSRSVLHSTGYYGLRGHEILSAHVVSHFKDAIHSLAGIDSVASKYGTVVYAQEVLVPELLEMLVQEDMRVDAKVARRILKESNEIGNLLNLE
ncbi:predicted protein [Histoplasma mississippiense (nom. inval.)]|uniref:predicted protein n=1 Tax=Ajellomyces capsulatus (strain NAm1 / WU24) TaxID=2059318 RepID=UPI000157D0EC|nr:predicted protein [Histoplasma mississippiense (nom. inval.)]EDN11071.1 predicted protein [Histoplasma mississippiense (nom. inval.)]